MAYVVQAATAAISAATFYQAEYNTFANAATNYALTSALTLPVTFATGGSQTALALRLFTSATVGQFPATLQVRLQENVATVWTTRTTDTWEWTAWTGLSAGAGTSHFPIVVIPLTAYTVTTAASTWRYEISISAGNNANKSLIGTSGVYACLAFLDNAVAIAGTDTLVLKNSQTSTLDQNLTLGNGMTYAMVIPDNATFQWDDTPAASYTLTTYTPIFTSDTPCWFKMGTYGGTRIPYAQQAIWDVSNVTFMYVGQGDFTTFGSKGQKFEFYGEERDDKTCRLSARAASGQANLALASDMTATWQIGDTVSIIGFDTSVASGTTHTINNITATTLTLNANLTAAVFSWGEVINVTQAQKMGVKITSPTASTIESFRSQGQLDYMKMSGVHIKNVNMNILTACVTGDNTFDNIFIESDGTTTARIVSSRDIRFSATSGNMSATDIVETRNSNSTSGAAAWFATNSVNGTMTNIRGRGGYQSAGVNIQGNNNTLSEIRIADVPRSGVGGAFYLLGANNSITNLYTTPGEYSLYLQSTINNTFTNCVFEADAGSQYIRCEGNNINDVFNGCTFGSAEATNFSTDLYDYDANSFNQIFFNGCPTRATALQVLTSVVNGSFWKFHEFNNTDNDHRSQYLYGQIVSTGTGLTDTTVHTAGGFALRMEPLSSTNNLTWQFDVPTGNIQNNTMFVGAWCKINSATYYAGTHQLPRLTVSYDNGVSTAYAQAAQSTAWQLLLVPITPTTTFGQITLTASSRTDATTTNAYVYWDDFMIAYPPNVALDLGAMDLWANALPITPPIAIPISAKTVSSAVWEELLTSHTTASTFGKQVGNKLLTVAKFLGLK